MTTEIWKQIINFSKYEISNLGNIRNFETKLILQPSIKGGYYIVSIKNDENNKRQMVSLHRLVAIQYIENTENKKTVNHIDHNKLNNNITNLEWATQTEQNNHKRKCKSSPTRFQPIWRIDKNTNKKIEHYISISHASKWAFDNKLSKRENKSNISSVASGNRELAFGFKWVYDSTNTNDLIDEMWKDIPINIVNGKKGYQISNKGRVKRINSKRISEGFKSDGGYLRIGISDRIYSLHRLVAEVFIPNPDNKEQVNHIDGDKLNANAINLEWCTNKENSQHAHDTGLHPNTVRIVQYDLQANKINEFKSCQDASTQLGICRTDINKCCLGKTKTAGGFIFKRFDFNNENIELVEKRIIQYDLQGNQIKVFNSQGHASKELDIFDSQISACCLGKAKTAGGFIFKNFDSNIQNIKPIENNIIQCDLQGNKINEFKSCQDASTQLKIGRTDINKCCLKKAKTAGGFIFKYSIEEYNSDRIIIQYDLQGNKMNEFKSCKDASRQLMVGTTGINKCCNGNQKTAGGFIFKFKNK